MTTTHYRNRKKLRLYRYPNAASQKYFWDKAADIALCITSGIGVAAILVFVLTFT